MKQFFATHFNFLIFLLIISLLFIVLASVSIGAVPIPINTVWKIFIYKLGFTSNSTWSMGFENIVWLIRFPRVILALIVGAGLAVVGTALQALVKNSLADPYILGISSGASVGAILAISLGASIAGPAVVEVGGFVGAIISLSIVYTLSRFSSQFRTSRLILAGMGVAYAFNGLASFIILTSRNKDLVGQILSWTLGSLARASWSNIGIPAIVVIIISVYFISQARRLNVLMLGEETATTLGINVNKFQQGLFVLIAITTGVLVAVSGPIGFVGLMIPHSIRLFLGSDHRYVFPVSALIGSIFLILVDLIARAAFSPIELPVGVITSLLGGPFFLFLLWRVSKNKKMY
jgi:iron complex transport system permease protein